jgi:hypothetical protein
MGIPKSFILRLLITIIILMALLLWGHDSSPSLAQANLILEDKFNDNRNGWRLASTQRGNLAIRDGVMDFALNEATSNVAYPEIDLPADVDIQVEAQVASPLPATPSDYYLGLILRSGGRTSRSDSYEFNLWGNGYWAFYSYTGSNQRYVTHQDGYYLSFDPKKPITLRAVLQGNIISLYIDGNKLATFVENSRRLRPRQQYYVGIVLTGYNLEKSVRVQFRNFRISRMDPLPTPAPTLHPTQGKQRPSPAPTVVLLPAPFDQANKNNWSLHNEENATLDVTDTALTMQLSIGTDSVTRLATLDRKLPADVDVSVVAQATDTSPHDIWSYGIAFRMENSTASPRFYLFRVFADGNWGLQIRNIDPEVGTSLIRGIIPPDEFRRLPGFNAKGANRLRMVVSGNRIILYFNNRELGRVEDDTLNSPNDTGVALMAGLAADSGQASRRVKVTFTDFKIVAPNP